MGKEWSYLEIPSINHIRPNPRILLGKLIYWFEKRDGSCIATWLDEKNKLIISSRRMKEASKDLQAILKRTEEYSKIKDLLLNQRKDWNTELIIFGELLSKGKSPARFELHDKEEYIIFDMWYLNEEHFLPYNRIYQYCYQWRIPIVEQWGESKHRSIKSLLKFRDEMLKLAKEKGREGVVLKTWYGKEYIYAKAKLDDPPRPKKIRIENDKPLLPVLPESETYGAIDKVFVDLGLEKFKDVKIAMPLVAQSISKEAKKHICTPPIKMFKYYQKYLEEKLIGSNLVG